MFVFLPFRRSYGPESENKRQRCREASCDVTGANDVKSVSRHSDSQTCRRICHTFQANWYVCIYKIKDITYINKNLIQPADFWGVLALFFSA